MTLLLVACRVYEPYDYNRSSIPDSMIIVQEAPHDAIQNDFTGAESCKECHLEIYHRWKLTAHNRELRKQDYEFPPHQGSCRRCHHTSLQETVVSCETCHGPRASHVRQPYQDEISRCTVCDAHKMCIKCHMRSVDPDFEPAKGWAKVDHGKQK